MIDIIIDIIWVKKNAPAYAFEVESTTSVYSGLLRMSDLLESAPSININLYIVAPKEREGKVIEELTRPTFKRIGLNDYCKFISIEVLEDLVKKVHDLRGHVQPSIIDRYAVEAGIEGETI